MAPVSHPQAIDTCGRWMQVASKAGITVGQLQEEFTRWDEQYDSSTAAAGPAKRRLRNEFIRGTYQQLLSNVERAQSQRLQEAERRATEVGGSIHKRPSSVLPWARPMQGPPPLAAEGITAALPVMRGGKAQCALHCPEARADAASPCSQERHRAEQDRGAVAAAKAEAERERQSREHLQQQLTSLHSRVCPMLPQHSSAWHALSCLPPGPCMGLASRDPDMLTALHGWPPPVLRGLWITQSRVHELEAVTAGG